MDVAARGRRRYGRRSLRAAMALSAARVSLVLADHIRTLTCLFPINNDDGSRPNATLHPPLPLLPSILLDVPHGAPETRPTPVPAPRKLVPQGTHNSVRPPRVMIAAATFLRARLHDDNEAAAGAPAAAAGATATAASLLAVRHRARAANDGYF